MHAYVGSYTTEARRARGNGINVYRVDAASGAWTHVQKLGLINPSFLAIGRGGRVLYSVHGDRDEITAFAIERESGRLALLNQRSAGGVNLVHLALDPAERFIVTANYKSGTLTSLPLEADGSLGAPATTIALPGEPGPHRIEQASSHPHHCPFDPSGRFVLVPDKGLDRIFVFRFEAGTGGLVPNDPPFVASRSGAAPRHIAFHPAAPYAYVVNELDSTVATYRWDTARGTLSPLQIVPSLPASYTGDNTGSEIAIAASGRFVYVSNRGHDSIGIFAVAAGNGTLAPVGWQPSGGAKPRFFALDPQDRFLYAANEAGDTIVAFRVDAAAGTLAPTGEAIANASPACIVFAGA